MGTAMMRVEINRRMPMSFVGSRKSFWVDQGLSVGAGCSTGNPGDSQFLNRHYLTGIDTPFSLRSNHRQAGQFVSA
jgi:hypothetical protein